MSTRILVVEDQDIAQLVARYLEKAGFTADRSSSIPISTWCRPTGATSR